MNNGLFRALMVMPMMLTLAMAFYMAANGVKGYGWVLFAALLMSPSFKIKYGKDENKKT